MKDLTRKELLLLIKESNKDILDEFVDTGEQLRATRVSQHKVYEDKVTQVRRLLLQMADDVAVDKKHGNISDSDLEYLIGDICKDLYNVVATLENTLVAIKAGTFQGRGAGNIIYPTSYED